MSDFLILAELLVVRKNTVGLEKFGSASQSGELIRHGLLADLPIV